MYWEDSGLPGCHKLWAGLRSPLQAVLRNSSLWAHNRSHSGSQGEAFGNQEASHSGLCTGTEALSGGTSHWKQEPSLWLYRNGSPVWFKLRNRSTLCVRRGDKSLLWAELRNRSPLRARHRNISPLWTGHRGWSHLSTLHMGRKRQQNRNIGLTHLKKLSVSQKVLCCKRRFFRL